MLSVLCSSGKPVSLKLIFYHATVTDLTVHAEPHYTTPAGASKRMETREGEVGDHVGFREKLVVGMCNRDNGGIERGV